MFGKERPDFWAKTCIDGTPGISVRDHCLNVGAVAEALLEELPTIFPEIFLPGAATLAALHDVGKISCGFQVKCTAWLEKNALSEAALRERWVAGAESDMPG